MHDPSRAEKTNAYSSGEEKRQSSLVYVKQTRSEEARNQFNATTITKVCKHQTILNILMLFEDDLDVLVYKKDEEKASLANISQKGSEKHVKIMC